MKYLKNNVLAILLATIWISLSEFARNEFLLKSYWTDHYRDHVNDLPFPDDPLNGAVWGLWSLLFAIVIFIISRKFTLGQTTLLSWFAGFVLMWVVTWNMGVLPASILVYAVPLSLLEAFIATLIIKKLAKHSG